MSLPLQRGDRHLGRAQGPARFRRHPPTVRIQQAEFQWPAGAAISTAPDRLLFTSQVAIITLRSGRHNRPCGKSASSDARRCERATCDAVYRHRRQRVTRSNGGVARENGKPLAVSFGGKAGRATSLAACPSRSWPRLAAAASRGWELSRQRRAAEKEVPPGCRGPDASG